MTQKLKAQHSSKKKASKDNIKQSTRTEDAHHSNITDANSNSTGDLKQNNGDGDADDIPQHDQRIANASSNTPHRQLPNEIVSLIIDQIPLDHMQQKTIYQCSLVNKQFHGISNPLLWQSPRLWNADRTKRFITGLFNTTLQRQRTMGQYIEELSIENWKDDSLTRLLPLVPRLQHLHMGFREKGQTDRILMQIPRHCQQLNSLQLVDPPRFSHRCMSAFAQHLHQLKYLYLDHCHNMTPEWLDLFTTCPIECLVLVSGGEDIDDDIMPIIQKFDLLTSLKVADTTTDYPYNVNYDVHFLPANPLRSISSTTTATICWPQLTQICLQKVYGLDDAMWIPFVKTHPHLKNITLNSTRLTDTSLDAMTTWLPDLEYLVLEINTQVTSEGARRFLRLGRQLKEVEYKWCDRVCASHFPEATIGDTGFVIFYEPEMKLIKASSA